MREEQDAAGGLEATPGATDVSNNTEPKTEIDDEPPKEGFGTLLVCEMFPKQWELWEPANRPQRVFAFGKAIDRTIQIVSALAAIFSGTGTSTASLCAYSFTLTIIAAMPLMALVLGRLTANFTDFGSANNGQSSKDFMKQVETNAYVSCQSLPTPS